MVVLVLLRKVLERFTQFDDLRCGLLPNKLCPLLWRNLSIFIKGYQVLLHEFLIELTLPAPEVLSHSFQCILFGCFLCSRGESDGSLQCCPQELLCHWDVLHDKESATVTEFGAGLTRCNRLPFNTDLCYCINAGWQLVFATLAPSSFQRQPRGTRSFGHRCSCGLWRRMLWRR